jgi:hypothetical protein
MAIYEVAIFGDAVKPEVRLQFQQLHTALTQVAEKYGLEQADGLRVVDNPAQFQPGQRSSAVVVFFGSNGAATMDLGGRFDVTSTTVIPVAQSSANGVVEAQIPEAFRHLNCLFFDQGGVERVTSCVLECLGLLRRQRRVFLSYCRSESRHAALQLFNELSARGYEVFLDTHGVPPAVDFQDVLWHALCDADVMVMLDTPTYFERRWTAEEFGRALAKNLGVLRVLWPGTTISHATRTASIVELAPEDIDGATGALSTASVDQICHHLESFRSLSQATRRLSIMGQLQLAVENIGGEVLGVGKHYAMSVKLPGKGMLELYPVLGVPSAIDLEESLNHSGGRPSAIAYDHVGMLPRWSQHLDWLGKNIASTCWIRVSQAAWDLAGVTNQ